MDSLGLLKIIFKCVGTPKIHVSEKAIGKKDRSGIDEKYFNCPGSHDNA